MDTQRYIALLRTDLNTMAETTRSVDLETLVPSCPGWTVRDLIVHTGMVHRHKAETLRGDYRDEPAPLPEIPDESESDAAVLGWFGEGCSILVDACVAADPKEPTWTWCAHQHTKDWWVRRMAHETAIHRADAELAVGRTPHLDPSLAVDGVAEILDEMMVGGPAWSTVEPTERTVRLVVGERSWSLRTATFSGTSPRSARRYDAVPTLVYDSGSEPMATIAADPETMDLWLWGRGVLPPGSVEGDQTMAEVVRQRAAAATG